MEYTSVEEKVDDLSKFIHLPLLIVPICFK